MAIYVEQAIDEFLYSNIVDLVDEWDETVTYALGDIIRVGSYQYKSTVDGNIENNPEDTLNIYWFKWDVANVYAMLDINSDTQTEWDADGIVEFSRGTKDTFAIGNFQANLITIEYIDALDVVVDTDTYEFSVNGDVWDEWDYGYAGFTDSVTKTVFIGLKRNGVKIRVTFSYDTKPTYCGFMIAGEAVYMGATLDKVSFPDKRIGNLKISVADFTTTIPKKDLMRTMEYSKEKINIPIMVVIDEDPTSYFENAIILGKITECTGVGENMSENQIKWQITQNTSEDFYE